MNHQEISEIRKTFEMNSQNITRICGCYVGRQEVLGTWNTSFWSMEELDTEDQVKYLEIFRKCLSGHIDRQLFNVTPSEEVIQELQEVRGTGCKDPYVLMHHIYGKIIDQMDFIKGDYLILCIHAVYDIPGKATDNTVMEDASEEVYDHILICICPVDLSKPEMGPAAQVKKEGMRPFMKLDPRRILKKPEIAILYPAFNDRSADLAAALVYTKSMDQDKKEFIYYTLGAEIPNTPREEEAIFSRIVAGTLGAEAKLEDIQAITEEIWKTAEFHKEESIEKIDLDGMRSILKAAGISEKQLSRLPQVYMSEAGKDTKLSLNNLVRRGKDVINTECGSFKLEPYARDRVLIRNVEGRSYLCFELDPGNIQVNGIEMRVGGEV